MAVAPNSSLLHHITSDSAVTACDNLNNSCPWVSKKCNLYEVVSICHNIYSQSMRAMLT